MGRRAAIALHLALFVLGGVLYVVFVLPRWWVLTGDIPPTLATAGRIAVGLPIGAAAVPVWLILQRSLRPSAATPELALRLRAWSAVLHVVAGGLILLAAIVEIWLSLTVGGPWLFGVYGAAGAIAILAVAAFYLSFIAEKPPGPEKPPKPAKAPKAKKEKRRARKPEEQADETSGQNAVEGDTTEVADVAEVAVAAETAVAEPAEADPDAGGEALPVDSTGADSNEADSNEAEAETVAAESAEAAVGLRNKRPADKTRRRLRR